MNRRFKPLQLAHLTAAHFKEVTRQPAVIFWGIIFPILISLGLGLAFTRQTETERRVAVVPPAIQENAGDAGGKVHAFLQAHAVLVKQPDTGKPQYRLVIEDEAMGRTSFVFIEAGWQQALSLLKKGNVCLIMKDSVSEINQDTGRDISYHLDPVKPEAQIAYLKLSKMMSAQGPPEAAISRNVSPLSVPGSRYIDFLVPGLISMGVMMSCMWGIGYGMIDKRSKKMLRRMVATPMRKSHFLMALMAVRVAMNVIEAGLLFFFAALAFDISIQGSLPALFVVFLAGNFAFGGIAILTASHTANTEVGNGLINAVVLPMSVLSGIFFSYHNFPDWSIPVIEKLPLTLLADGVRSIFIEGAGFAETAWPALILLAIGGFFFAAGLRVFRWH
ncbi:MAG: ABC transporter permease [Desulfosalsimonadaceae bacterium]